MINLAQANSTIIEGKPLNVTCSVTSSEPVSYSWLLPNRANVTSNILQINNISKLDAGNYSSITLLPTGAYFVFSRYILSDIFYWKYLWLLFRIFQTKFLISWSRFSLFQDEALYPVKSRSLICKSVSMDWFLYFRDFCHERVKTGWNVTDLDFSHPLKQVNCFVLQNTMGIRHLFTLRYKELASTYFKGAILLFLDAYI